MLRSFLLVVFGLAALVRPAGAWQDDARPDEGVSPLHDLRNEVELTTRLMSRVPEGSLVRKGDVVLRLDDSAVLDLKTNQEIVCERAEAEFENARKTREVAEIAITEYEQGVFPQELQAIEGEKTLAEAELERSKVTLRWSEEMLRKGSLSEGQVIADRLTLLKAEISRAQANKKREILETYTHDKQSTLLTAEAKKARSEERALEQMLALERSKLEKLRAQVERCTVRAPFDGLVVYPTGSDRVVVGDRPIAGQLLARIVPIPEGR